MEPKLWTTAILILAATLAPSLAETTDSKQSAEEPSTILARTADLEDFDLDLAAEESSFDLSGAPADAEPRFKMPFSYAFNGGKPFSLEKDPITGKIDFEKAPPLKALNYTHQYDDLEVDVSEDFPKKDLDKHDGTDVEPNEINPYSSLHDFLNLPAHYSSDRYDSKYPLISSSYANTKVQSGSNSYSVSNHRPFHDSIITPFYVPSRKVYVPKASSTSTTTTTTMRTTTSSTTQRPTTTTTRAPTTTTARSTTTTSTTPSTTTSTSTTTTTEKYTSMMEELDRILSSSTEAEPKDTTSKPTSKAPSRVENYENSAAKEQPQKQSVNDIQASSKPTPVMDEYDGYEDYEVSVDEDYHRKWVSNKTKGNTPAMQSSEEEMESTPMASSSTTTSTTMASTTSEEPVVEVKKDPMTKVEVNSQLVTSMPIENPENVFHSMHPEGVLQGHRPDFSMPAGHVRFPSSGGYDRPVQVESTSNIIVRPDQDTVSFVLGNRQNVEDVYYTQGTAVGENPYEEGAFRPLPNNNPNVNNYHTFMSGPMDHPSVGLPSISVESAFNYQPERWYQQPQKLGSNEVSETELPNGPVNGPVNGTEGSVVIQQQQIEKLDEKKDESTKPFIPFPTPNKNQDSHRPVEEHVVVINEADGTVQEIAPSTVPPRGNPEIPGGEKDNVIHRIIPNSGLPQLSENLTPPERPKPSGPAQRPSFYYHYRPVGTSRPDFNRPQKIPMPPLPPPSRTKPNLQDPLSFKRRPLPQDAKLPNILPQFRPNSKASHGHRNPDIIGTLPAPQPYGNRRSPLPPHPPHMNRRPTGPPSSPILQRLIPPPIPGPGPNIHHIRGPAASSKEDTLSQNPEIIPNRFRPPSLNVPVRDEDRTRFQLPKQKIRLEEDQSERFSIEPPQVPPRPLLYPKHRTNDHIPRVATLQMIQQRGGLDSEIQSINVDANTEVKDENDNESNSTEDESKSENSDKAPVYVVYPVNTALNIGQEEPQEQDETVVVGTRGPHRPLPPDTLQQEEEAQKESDEKKIPMMVLPVRPQMHSSPPVMASDFPYPLERPDPTLLSQSVVREKPLLMPKDPDSNKHASMEDNDDENNDNTSVNVIPYLQDFVPFAAKKNHISATLQKLPSSTPIAYVYTPTAQTLTHRADIISRDEESLYEHKDEKPILLPSQQPSSSSSSAPSPQNFMAPFVASMSVEAPAKNGWSVVVVNSNEDSKNSTVEEKKSNSSLTAEDTQTERNDFDPDNFKPQLFGGFQPIYEFPNESENDEIVNLRTGDASPDMPRSLRKK